MLRFFAALCSVSIISVSSTKFRIHETEDFVDTEETVFDSFINMTELEPYPNVCDEYSNENCAKAWLEEIDIVLKRNSNRVRNINIRYITDINSENGKLKMKFQFGVLKINEKLNWKVNQFQWQQFKSPKIKRIFKLFTSTIQSSNATVSATLLTITQRMKSIYSHGEPCYKYCLVKGEQGISELFRTERDYDKLAGFWSSWRNVTGRRIRNSFIRKMNLENIGAKENGYSDAASFKLKDEFEENNFNETIIRLYEDILPLYKQLHAYVRYCLAKFYPDRFDKTGPIPAHILGSNWAHTWNNIYPIIQACRGRKVNFNIQEEANKKLQFIPVKKMFQMAEEFFTSIGLYKMTPNFWQRSVIESQPGKMMECHGSAEDFSNGLDFRITMCAKSNLNSFTTIHHEMGHIQYFMAFRKMPFAFQNSPNVALHEAIGDTIVLAVKTPEHLKRIGLIPTIPLSEEFDIDYLLLSALERVTLLPFALTMDLYIWNVYNGSVPLDRLNRHWWDLIYRYRGLKPPIPRTEEDFDPAAIFHIAFGFSYIRYFVSFIHQFQFYETMCNLSGYRGSLHRCDFYNSKVAGRRLLKMLKKGHSVHWRDSLELFINSREISSKSLLKFFDPLFHWLKKTNEILNITIGW